MTSYVREEFNRAKALQNDKRAGTVGFALTVLQRRLASSPEAIFQSLSRRPECRWISRELEQRALGHAIATVAPSHLEVRARRARLIEKTRAAVKDRLTKQISY